MYGAHILRWFPIIYRVPSFIILDMLRGVLHRGMAMGAEEYQICRDCRGLHKRARGKKRRLGELSHGNRRLPSERNDDQSRT